MLKVSQIRKDFPILERKVNGKPLVYLDNAATSQKPKQLIRAISEYYEKYNANVHRGIHSLSEEASQLYEEAREVVAGFIGAEKDELVFVRNATEGINLVAWAWLFKNLKPGDEVVTTVMEHHANLIPWQEVCQRIGAKLKVVEIKEDGRLDGDDFKKKLSKKTKLVAVAQMSNVTGVINPVEEIVKESKKAGARVLVDAAQGVQHIGADVKKIKCDFLVFSSHKMMGPMGGGGVYFKKEVQEEMGVFLTGGGMISEVYKDKPAKWAEGVEKWEAGTPDVASAIGLAEAVKYHQKLGMEQIRKHEKELTKYALERLGKVKGLRLVGPKDMEMRGGVVSWVMKGIHAHDVAQVLDSEGVAVRSGHHCAMPLHERLGIAASTRASFYVYNTKEEIDRLIEGLEKVKKMLR